MFLTDGDIVFWSPLNKGIMVSDLIISISSFTLENAQKNVSKLLSEIIPTRFNSHKLTVNISNNINETAEIIFENLINGKLIFNGNNNSIKNQNQLICEDLNIQIIFNNIIFNCPLYISNCFNIIFNNCTFNKLTNFDNSHIILNSCTFNVTLNGKNSSMIQCFNCKSTTNKKTHATSNSQISWIGDEILSSYNEYLKTGNYNNLTNIISTNIYSGNELIDQNALNNHYHQYPEFRIPIEIPDNVNEPQKINTTYISNVPIGSVIYWPEVIRERGSNELPNSYSNNFVLLTPKLKSGFARCNGDNENGSLENTKLLHHLIGNNFNKNINAQNIVYPNFVSSYINKEIKNDIYNEIYPLDTWMWGGNEGNIKLDYIGRWLGGNGSAHNGSPNVTQTVNQSGSTFTVTTSAAGSIRETTGSCIVLRLKLPKSIFDNLNNLNDLSFFKNGYLSFIGGVTGNRWI